MASFISFARGHAGGERANASVGAAFVIGALVVAVLGLRWVSASGPSEAASDDTPWSFEDPDESGPTTTIPASIPAEVVPIKDPGVPQGPTATTIPGQTGIFLPGFSPTPGGGTGPTTIPGSPPTTRGGGTSPTTRPGGIITFPPPSTGPTTSPTDPPPTDPPPTDPPPTDPPPTDPPPTDPPPTEPTLAGLPGGQALLDISGLLGRLDLQIV